MGPPKRRPRKTLYSELKRRFNYFEYRWDFRTGTYYLFNPWTGETIFSINLEVLNRQRSMWAKPEKYPADDARYIQLHPEFYLSRQWGRRKFYPFESEQQAAIVLTAVARGFLSRLWLRRYYRSRYYTMADQFSGYLYYVDRDNPCDETKWFKPRLAFPDDILPLVVDDPDDYMKGSKFSKQDFKVGPLIKVVGLNKDEQDRADLQVFTVHNEWREIAGRTYDDIDISQVSINDVLAWMDGNKVGELRMNEYHFMRAAVQQHDWGCLIFHMRQHPSNILIQLFGFLGFSKTPVPHESPILIDENAREAMDMCIEIIHDKDNKCIEMLKIAAFHALHNLLSCRPGRTDFLNTDSVTEMGEFRQQAMEAYLKTKFSVFNRYLSNIPNETILVYERGQDVPVSVTRPLGDSIEVVAMVLRVLALLAQELEIREQLAFNCIQHIVFAMKICEDESFVLLSGIQLLYNLCYRCESGQEAVLLSLEDPDESIRRWRHKHSGDQELMRQCHRLELSLKKNGWSGNVEEVIAREMKTGYIDEEYLLDSEYKHK